MLMPKLHTDPIDDTYKGGLRRALGLRDALYLPAAAGSAFSEKLSSRPPCG